MMRPVSILPFILLVYIFQSDVVIAEEKILTTETTTNKNINEDFKKYFSEPLTEETTEGSEFSFDDEEDDDDFDLDFDTWESETDTSEDKMSDHELRILGETMRQLNQNGDQMSALQKKIAEEYARQLQLLKDKKEGKLITTTTTSTTTMMPETETIQETEEAPYDIYEDPTAKEGTSSFDKKIYAKSDLFKFEPEESVNNATKTISEESEGTDTSIEEDKTSTIGLKEKNNLESNTNNTLLKVEENGSESSTHENSTGESDVIEEFIGTSTIKVIDNNENETESEDEDSNENVGSEGSSETLLREGKDSLNNTKIDGSEKKNFGEEELTNGNINITTLAPLETNPLAMENTESNRTTELIDGSLNINSSKIFPDDITTSDKKTTSLFDKSKFLDGLNKLKLLQNKTYDVSTDDEFNEVEPSTTTTLKAVEDDGIDDENVKIGDEKESSEYDNKTIEDRKSNKMNETALITEGESDKDIVISTDDESEDVNKKVSDTTDNESEADNLKIVDTDLATEYEDKLNEDGKSKKLNETVSVKVGTPDENEADPTYDESEDVNINEDNDEQDSENEKKFAEDGKLKKMNETLSTNENESDEDVADVKKENEEIKKVNETDTNVDSEVSGYNPDEVKLMEINENDNKKLNETILIKDQNYEKTNDTSSSSDNFEEGSDKTSTTTEVIDGKFKNEVEDNNSKVNKSLDNEGDNIIDKTESMSSRNSSTFSDIEDVAITTTKLPAEDYEIEEDVKLTNMTTNGNGESLAEDSNEIIRGNIDSQNLDLNATIIDVNKNITSEIKKDIIIYDSEIDNNSETSDKKNDVIDEGELKDFNEEKEILLDSNNKNVTMEEYSEMLSQKENEMDKEIVDSENESEYDSNTEETESEATPDFKEDKNESNFTVGEGSTGTNKQNYTLFEVNPKEVEQTFNKTKEIWEKLNTLQDVLDDNDDKDNKDKTKISSEAESMNNRTVINNKKQENETEMFSTTTSKIENVADSNSTTSNAIISNNATFIDSDVSDALKSNDLDSDYTTITNNNSTNKNDFNETEMKEIEYDIKNESNSTLIGKITDGKETTTTEPVESAEDYGYDWNEYDNENTPIDGDELKVNNSTVEIFSKDKIDKELPEKNGTLNKVEKENESEFNLAYDGDSLMPFTDGDKVSDSNGRTIVFNRRKEASTSDSDELVIGEEDLVKINSTDQNNELFTPEEVIDEKILISNHTANNETQSITDMKEEENDNALTFESNATFDNREYNQEYLTMNKKNASVIDMYFNSTDSELFSNYTNAFNGTMDSDMFENKLDHEAPELLPDEEDGSNSADLTDLNKNEVVLNKESGIVEEENKTSNVDETADTNEDVKQDKAEKIGNSDLVDKDALIREDKILKEIGDPKERIVVDSEHEIEESEDSGRKDTVIGKDTDEDVNNKNINVTEGKNTESLDEKRIENNISKLGISSETDGNDEEQNNNKKESSSVLKENIDINKITVGNKEKVLDRENNEFENKDKKSFSKPNKNPSIFTDKEKENKKSSGNDLDVEFDKKGVNQTEKADKLLIDNNKASTNSSEFRAYSEVDTQIGKNETDHSSEALPKVEVETFTLDADKNKENTVKFIVSTATPIESSTQKYDNEQSRNAGDDKKSEDNLMPDNGIKHDVYPTESEGYSTRNPFQLNSNEENKRNDEYLERYNSTEVNENRNEELKENFSNKKNNNEKESENENSDDFMNENNEYNISSPAPNKTSAENDADENFKQREGETYEEYYRRYNEYFSKENQDRADIYDIGQGSKETYTGSNTNDGYGQKSENSMNNYEDNNAYQNSTYRSLESSTEAPYGLDRQTEEEKYDEYYRKYDNINNRENQTDRYQSSTQPPVQSSTRNPYAYEYETKDNNRYENYENQYNTASTSTERPVDSSTARSNMYDGQRENESYDEYYRRYYESLNNERENNEIRSNGNEEYRRYETNVNSYDNNDRGYNAVPTTTQRSIESSTSGPSEYHSRKENESYDQYYRRYYESNNNDNGSRYYESNENKNMYNNNRYNTEYDTSTGDSYEQNRPRKNGSYENYYKKYYDSLNRYKQAAAETREYLVQTFTKYPTPSSSTQKPKEYTTRDSDDYPRQRENESFEDYYRRYNEYLNRKNLEKQNTFHDAYSTQRPLQASTEKPMEYSTRSPSDYPRQREGESYEEYYKRYNDYFNRENQETNNNYYRSSSSTTTYKPTLSSTTDPSGYPHQRDGETYEEYYKRYSEYLKRGNQQIETSYDRYSYPSSTERPVESSNRDPYAYDHQTNDNRYDEYNRQNYYSNNKENTNTDDNRYNTDTTSTRYPHENDHREANDEYYRRDYESLKNERTENNKSKAAERDPKYNNDENSSGRYYEFSRNENKVNEDRYNEVSTTTESSKEYSTRDPYRYDYQRENESYEEYTRRYYESLNNNGQGTDGRYETAQPQERNPTNSPTRDYYENERDRYDAQNGRYYESNDRYNNNAQRYDEFEGQRENETYEEYYKRYEEYLNKRKQSIDNRYKIEHYPSAEIRDSYSNNIESSLNSYEESNNNYYANNRYNMQSTSTNRPTEYYSDSSNNPGRRKENESYEDYNRKHYVSMDNQNPTQIASESSTRYPDEYYNQRENETYEDYIRRYYESINRENAYNNPTTTTTQRPVDALSRDQYEYYTDKQSYDESYRSYNAQGRDSNAYNRHYPTRSVPDVNYEQNMRNDDNARYYSDSAQQSDLNNNFSEQEKTRNVHNNPSKKKVFRIVTSTRSPRRFTVSVANSNTANFHKSSEPSNKNEVSTQRNTGDINSYEIDKMLENSELDEKLKQTVNREEENIFTRDEAPEQIASSPEERKSSDVEESTLTYSTASETTQYDNVVSQNARDENPQETRSFTREITATSSTADTNSDQNTQPVTTPRPSHNGPKRFIIRNSNSVSKVQSKAPQNMNERSLEGNDDALRYEKSPEVEKESRLQMTREKQPLREENSHARVMEGRKRPEPIRVRVTAEDAKRREEAEANSRESPYAYGSRENERKDQQLYEENFDYDQQKPNQPPQYIDPKPYNNERENPYDPYYRKPMVEVDTDYSNFVSTGKKDDTEYPRPSPLYREQYKWPVARGTPRNIACLQMKDPGSGPDETNAWFFNQNNGKCEWFPYGGYGGTANRFYSRSACINLCINNQEDPCMSGQRCWQGTDCRPVEDQSCIDYQRRNGVDPLTKCPPKQPVCMTRRGARIAPIIKTTDLPESCRHPADQGSCRQKDPVVLYYYDTEQNICQSFYFHKCGGNPNRFKTKMECMNHCSP